MFFLSDTLYKKIFEKSNDLTEIRQIASQKFFKKLSRPQARDGIPKGVSRKLEMETKREESGGGPDMAGGGCDGDLGP